MDSHENNTNVNTQLEYIFEWFISRYLFAMIVQTKDYNNIITGFEYCKYLVGLDILYLSLLHESHRLDCAIFTVKAPN